MDYTVTREARAYGKTPGAAVDAAYRIAHGAAVQRANVGGYLPTGQQEVTPHVDPEREIGSRDPVGWWAEVEVKLSVIPKVSGL